jgi:hypothetical protein
MSNNDYYNKYIKYKIKYLELLNMKGGSFGRAAQFAATSIDKNPKLKSSLLNAAKSVAKSVKDDPKFQKELITAAAKVANKNPEGLLTAAANFANNPKLKQGLQRAAKLVNENNALEIVGKKIENTVSHASAAQAVSHASVKQLPPATSHAVISPNKELSPKTVPAISHDNQELVGRKIYEEILQIQAPRTNLMISLNGICRLAK